MERSSRIRSGSRRLAAAIEALLREQAGERGAGQRVIVDEENSFCHQAFSAYRQGCFCRQD
jgi:hypothetical protein